MKNKLTFTLLVILLITFFWLSPSIPAAASQNLPAVDVNHIKQATILITMQAPAQQKNALAHGMATIVQSQGKSFLVTHNHWGDVLQDLTSVEFRTAGNKLILPIFGKEFRRLVFYQDAGTLALYLPEGWPVEMKPASVELGLRLKVGDTVQVAYREKPNRTTVAVLDATVQAVSKFEGLPIYELRSLDGQALQPGDSGGGVWYNGKLVANNWAVVKASTPKVTSGKNSTVQKILTDQSYAAILPEDF